MKNLLKIAAIAVVTLMSYNCSVEPVSASDVVPQGINPINASQPSNAASLPCTNMNPQAQITNNSILTVDIEAFDSNGVLLDHAYATDPGNTSSNLSFPAGTITFVISTSASTKSIDINMSDCSIFQVIIDANNQLNTDQPTQL